MTRCAVGDLALVIGPPRALEVGHAVTCVCLHTQEVHIPHRSGRTLRIAALPLWFIDRPVTWTSANCGDILLPYYPDRWLMPIRPEPETLEDQTPALCRTGDPKK